MTGPMAESAAGIRGQPGELGADLRGLGVVDVVQDGERFFPDRASLILMPGGVVGVADVIERRGLAHRSPISRNSARAR